ncbi:MULTISPECIES: GNAT family N-acetyltransferase [unclassified Polaribacter]|jgi:putative acetyltransferase|uniref:GNAT family N-acetyltransferase n=1 Tax=unclassified Polaribacter TaxID=196858 RepID=UPI001C4E7F99|nr:MULTISPECIES: GNAT family N-acetyltransferase [unclassified Polaribacter]QXP68323.1 GNAT family N-acetyltransferase [Polaribacter sp. AHE13PA]QXP70498.1 GNAT family N-acetyltransferase [Polaribacter sp. R2A056_3_33]
MKSTDFIIREIQSKDNAQMATVIREVLLEMGAPKIGTAYEDKATDKMFENFEKPTSFYYVVEHNNKVVGGAGIAQLDNFEGNTCELQKMYFLPITRGKGLGSKLINTCLEKAKTIGFENCYLETMPYMNAAQALYKRNGFVNLDKPMGNTGHYSCPVWMLKKL